MTTSTYPFDGHEYWGNFVESLNTRMEENKVAIGTIVPKCRYNKRKKKHRLGTIEFSYFLPRQIQNLGCPPGLEHNSRSLHGKIQLPFYLLAFAFRLLLSTLRHKPHLLHANWAIPSGLVSWLVGKITNTPVLVTVLGADVYQKGLRKFMVKFVLERVDHVVACSEHVRRLLVEFATPRKLTVIPNSVDVQEIMSVKDRINPRTIKKKLGIDPEATVIFTIRRLVAEKRIADLVEAAAQVSPEMGNVIFLIGGFGPELDNLQKLAKQLNIESKVKFLGALPESEKLEILSLADICVQTSVQEGLSIALLEFMASGATVIASSAAGQSDVIVDGENGYLYPPADPESLAKLLIQCIRERNKDLGLSARKLIQDSYSFEVHTNHYLEVYKEFR